MTLFGGTDEQDTETAQALADALVDFQNNVLFSSLVNTVPIFKGERDKYKIWAQSIDSVLSLMSGKDLYAVRAAAQTSQGYVAHSIQEYWTEKKEASKWADLKKLLEAQFDFFWINLMLWFNFVMLSKSQGTHIKCLLKILNCWLNRLIQRRMCPMILLSGSW